MKSTRSCYPILFFFLVAIFWAACGGGDGTSSVSNTLFEASGTFSFTVDEGSRSLFGLKGGNGKITITGLPGATSITITGTKRVQSKSVEDAQAHLADIDVVVEERASEVLVETIQPQFTGGRNYIVDYTITLPSNFLVLVTNVNGNVTIDGIDNDVSVVKVNGDVTLLSINGSADPVALVNGTINADVTLPLNGTIDFDLVNGTIDLVFPVSTSAGFSAVVDNGTISVSNLMLQNEVITPTSHTGTLGTGEGTIDLEIDNGDINVSGF